MAALNIDDIREGALNRVERQAAMVRIAILGGVAVEALAIGLALWLVDWNDRTHVLIFVMGVLGYTIIVLALAALAAHVSRASNRIVAVLEALIPR